jgi:hypothetical protein
MEDTPDSPVFLQIDAKGIATVWVEVQDLVSPRPTLFYRQDRCSDGAVAVSFHLTEDVVQCFAVSRSQLIMPT